MNYKFLATFFAVAFQCQFISSQSEFPQSEPTVGYVYSKEHARVAFPIDGQNRIWLKGSSDFPIAIIYSNESLVNQTQLQPPFYTKVITVESDIVDVSFCNDSEQCQTKTRLYPGHYGKEEEGNFSILLYGCMEPFEVIKDENGELKAQIFKGNNNSSHKMRQLFKNVALGESLIFNDSIKNGWEYRFNAQLDTMLLSHLPKSIITTGDQVYVDAGYETKIKDGKHPLSAWETKRRPKPFDTSILNYQDHLNRLYQASYSLSDIESVHQMLPTISTIDDHEIRDGWGSQGDEYENGIMNPQLSDFFYLGKQAYIEHQLALSSYPTQDLEKLSKNNTTMDYAFNIHGKNGYVLDLRSARNINENQLLGEEQWHRLEAWLAGLEPNQEIILVTSVPVTLRPLKWIEDVYKLFKPELRDDVRDGWSARNNQEERNRLIELLTQYRIAKEIKPIFVSGDVHKSAIIEIWVDPNVLGNSRHDMQETMILGYEVIASGLSHEFIKTGLSKSIFKLLESQRLGDGFIDFTYFGNQASIYPMVWNSTVGQNFGALEFSESAKTKIHTFVYNTGSEQLEQRYIELDFDKTLPNPDYFEIKPNGDTDYQPPIPDGLRVILETTD